MRNSRAGSARRWRAAPSSRRPSGRSASWRWSGPGRCRRRGRCRRGRGAPREKGSKMRSRSAGAHAGAGVLDLEHAPSRAHAQRGSSRGPLRVNLTALPSRLIRIWRSRFSSARTTVGQRACRRRSAKRRPLAAACSSNMLHDLRAAPRAGAWAWASSASLPASMRAMSSVPSISDSRCSPPRRMTPTACLRCARHGGVFVQQLRVAQDAVERRAQLVADGADVAASWPGWRLGRRAWRAAAASVGAAVRVDLLHQQPRSGGWTLPAPPAALVRQHQPPGRRCRPSAAARSRP